MTSQEKKKVLVFVANGSEEMEAVISIDILRRAQLEVSVVGIAAENSSFVTCSRGVKIVPDFIISNAFDIEKLVFDAIVVPGGLEGAKTISSNPDVQSLLASAHKSGKIVAAICAGPLAIKTANINKGGMITSHPVAKADLENEYNYQEDRVVIDNNVITSRGPGTAFLFALTIVEQLLGKEKRDEISLPMILASSL
ncbi:7526_t:CDS:2 [Acaulospora morrowiae]|uniref:D-lactate dehydratase n=1 Tax=Acaulospora morrowiae TaxID=94023 RepID=A0A9N9NFF5_9GLOM|nr:7526_t:CDS:2 [Acaulospora morrowiae]